MVNAELADAIRLEIQRKYPPKHGSLSRFCEDCGIENSRLSEALNPDKDTLVSTLVDIVEALDLVIKIEPRESF